MALHVFTQQLELALLRVLRELPAVPVPAAVPTAVSTWYGQSFQNRTLVSVLERVGEPRVVNPDPLLRRAAVRRGWPVVRLRLEGGEPLPAVGG